jgi:hypothetical protein
MPPLVRKLLGFVFLIIVVGLCICCLRLVLPMLGLGEPANTIIMIVVAIVIICYIAYFIGVFPGGPAGPMT